ncbi:TasA family protein [Bacillus sp. ISL-45]|uniref:TasA family protein n=1 Tax=Bacillus sp. ISL-45 TaxID=2819128 RepID=UPI001BEB712A|nr:TasA family protein [Bacillus sp. ISL-45]MBT2661855.1 spore coat protein [Bacillus sp. ISL-45]MBT2663891.1 spore coat protein [Bacillus sp. ISL-45]
MSIKKKLGLSAASAALGLSLIGGGTWAAFNDVENTTNSLAAGTLNLGLNTAEDGVLTNFNLSNLKPGDQFTRKFKISNDGSLAIKQVWLDVLPSGFTQGINEYVGTHGATDNSQLDFLAQFAVEVFRTGVEGGSPGPQFNMITKAHNVTLKDLVTGENIPTGIERELDADGKVTRINLAPTNTTQPNWNGLPANPRDYEVVEIVISMINDSSKDARGEYTQNVYQGDSINLGFQFEATQWEGRKIDGNDTGDVDGNDTSNPGTRNNEEVTRP